MHAIVVGGGIGGAAAALALTRQGITVTLLEQAPVLAEVGAGLQVGANGTRILRQLGVLEKFRERAVQAQSYRILHFETGELVHEHPLGDVSAAHYGEPAFEAHRADILGALMSGLPDGAVRTGSKCVHVDQGEDGASVTLESGEILHADVVIGADGVHSVVRNTLFGETESVYSGTVAWRALIPADKVAHLGFEERFHGWRGAGRIAIGYWVRSKQLFNFAAFVPAEELQRESWSQSGKHEDLVRALAGCEPRLAGLVEAADENFITALYYRQPLEQWTRGRITLLGDSAHAMLPYMAQGAVQSMEDAVVLAECLGAASRDGTDVQAALLEYEARRRPRTTKVQNNVLSLREFWFATDPEQRMGGMRRMQAQDRMDPMAESQWEWIYSYDASLEAHAPGEYTLAMPASRTGRETVWPRKNADQRWSGIFADFDGLAVGNAGMRAAYESYFAAAVPAERSVQGGVECAVTGSVQADGPVIVHMHGGGYVLGSVAASMLYANALAKASGAAVVSVGYRRAPEHPFPAPVEDLLAVYRDLTASGVAPERIYFSGESSGAAIALSALMRLRDDGAELPRALVAVSPFADLTLSGESGAANGFGDEFINKDQLTYLATSYFQQHDPASAGVSPVFGDFAGLPPLLVFAARHEALASDAVRIVLNAEKAGTSARLVLAESTTHAFALFAGEPAAQAAIDLAGEFIRSLWEEPDVTLSDFMRRNLSLLQDIS